MNNCPALWDDLLKQVPKGSALMGGAIIDYLLGIPVNDYDIFYSYKPGQGFILPGNWVPTMANFNDPVWIEQHEAQYKQGIDEFGNHPISVVYEYMVDGIHKVQLIGVNYDNPLKHLKNFDHSLTLASYDAKGMFVHKKVFESKDNHIITYVSKNKEAKAVMKSMARAQKKIGKMPFDGHAWELQGFDPAPVPVLQGFEALDF
jgi:hypothetical protein